MSGPTPVAAAPSDKLASVRTAAAAADPAGYAQQRRRREQCAGAACAVPRAGRRSAGLGRQCAAEAGSGDRRAQRGGGAWAVIVAAQYADGRLRYFVVPVTADASGASFTVTGDPRVVAGPARAQEVQSPYTVNVPTDGDLSATTGEFLAAYLTGAGEVSFAWPFASAVRRAASRWVASAGRPLTAPEVKGSAASASSPSQVLPAASGTVPAAMAVPAEGAFAGRASVSRKRARVRSGRRRVLPMMPRSRSATVTVVTGWPGTAVRVRMTSASSRFTMAGSSVSRTARTGTCWLRASSRRT
ncbi:conjugal transfer protein [Streptomyces phaeochromogenes]